MRKVAFPFSEETPRYWFGGDPFRTHFLNALSSTFPEGEAFFVRSVRHYRDRIDEPGLRTEIQGFSGQEGVHSQEHARHVEILVGQGYAGLAKVNRMAGRELRMYNRRAPVFSLALTAALEHLTAILAHQILLGSRALVGPMHPDMQPLWRWHAVEEAEHKAVAFDVLARVSGSWTLRVVAGIVATLGLLTDNLIRTSYLLTRDRLMLSPMLWLRGLRALWGREGMLRPMLRDYLRWYRRDFHPWQRDNHQLIDAELHALADQGYLSG